MNYNTAMRALALTLLLAIPIAAADSPTAGGKAPGVLIPLGDAPADNDTIALVEKAVKGHVSELAPALVEPFLKVNPATLPKKLQGKAAARQLEIKSLLKVHDAGKNSGMVKAPEGCSEFDGLRPTSQIGIYESLNFGPVDELERDALEQRTLCTIKDMVCSFTLLIFHDKGSKKPRKLYMHERDPLQPILQQIRNKSGGQSNFFGIKPLTCIQP